ncbi:MAG: bifunctional (p)ppGpp synthetase/guanosine-3',5'-bis(diphosphate) 3'-pyrophosphohydrolase [Armatimonadetes bacterium]|nr:bifunctional (p)ppGpp synthetase/guanosine-3',5'-bis(diphosphate) 3'-pyrophosphohydrolase [Armatimonadota bacterium]
MASTFEISHQWEEPEGLHELLNKIRDLRPEADIRKIRYAYFVAEQAHAGQQRHSGEAYITHPLAVANILVDLKMDDDTIAAALLHDVLEDCPSYTRVELQQTFGDDVLQLVEGVTKLSFSHPTDMTDREKARAETTRTAESLRKMLLAMAKDFRVMVIKLADRLHNMQTLEALPPSKRLRIANETLDIYAPLAARLGIWQVKWSLEDLAFRHLHPNEYQEVEQLVARSRDERQRDLNQAIVMIKDRLNAEGVKFIEVQGRAKHLYSIFNKMTKQGFKFEDIMDLIAIRIIVPTKKDCFVTLMLIHDIFIPIDGLFSDYINKPKANGYQSIHTKVVGPHSLPLEVQIRTKEMHEVAEYGVAAHWTYKEGGTSTKDTDQFGRLREQLFNWSSDADSSSEYLRSLSTDLFSEQVFVFTPKGEVLDLPAGSTPVDFAFRVHTQLGLTLVGAKVNGQIIQLTQPLHNGDVVELMTRRDATPSKDWLEIAKSQHARTKLKAYFRKQSRDDDESRGRAALDKELKAAGLDPRQYMSEDVLKTIASHYSGVETGADLLAKIGAGIVSTQGVVQRFRGNPQETNQNIIQLSKTREGKFALVDSMDHVMLRRSKCCDPIPGDDVVGYVTRGRGIVLHRRICPNVLGYMTREPERLIPYNWPPDGRSYGVHLRIETVNRQGLLMDVSTIFAEGKANVTDARIRTMQNHTAEINVTIEVHDAHHLQQVFSKIGNLSDVLSVTRLFGRSAGR